MDNQKRSKPRYSLKGFSQNIFDEFYKCATTSDGLSKRYFGIFLYGVESDEILSIVKDEISRLMEREGMGELMNRCEVSYGVRAETKLPTEIPEFVRGRGKSGYQIIGLGWLLMRGG